MLRQVRRTLHNSLGCPPCLLQNCSVLLKPQVGESKSRQLPRLFASDQFAGAPVHQISFGDFKTVRGPLEDFQPLDCCFSRGVPPAPSNKEAIRRPAAAPDSATQLVKLSEAEPVSALDKHNGGFWDVHTHLHHYGGNENLHLSVHESFLDTGLLCRGHLAMEKAAFHTTELVLAELRELSLSGLQFSAFHDGGAHHKRLVALADLRQYCCVSVRARSWEKGPRCHGGPARGLLVDDAESHVTVQGQGESARDGRSGHGQDVRGAPRAPLLLQPCPLLHPKLVLLIHHCEGQVIKNDALADQCVRANDDPDCATRQTAQNMSPVRCFRGPREERNLRHRHARTALVQLIDCYLQGTEMLGRKEVRRRHQCTLPRSASNRE